MSKEIQHPLIQDKNLMVTKRDGTLVPFDANKIINVIQKAFQKDDPENGTFDVIEKVTLKVLDHLLKIKEKNKNFEIEMIQNAVEETLMQLNYYKVLRKYILIREERAKKRHLKDLIMAPSILIKKKDDSLFPLDVSFLLKKISRASSSLNGILPPEALLEEVIKNLYEGIEESKVFHLLISICHQKVEMEPNYTFVAARLLLEEIYKEVLGALPDDLSDAHEKGFKGYIEKGVFFERLHPDLLKFDLSLLRKELKPERDLKFTYLGLKTLYDRYLIHHEGTRIETPQFYWMRIAMGLSLKEKEKEKRAIEFYHLLSNFLFICSTPAQFNSGTLHPQMSACFLSTIEDTIESIFKVMGDNASLSKWSGGIGNDWTNIRATGAHIKGTNGKTQGIIPFLKVANDIAIAVNQGGKRKGAVCAYLETWHLDIEEFLELKKNTGDDRRRAHDMNTANWIPDLFMKRVKARSHWTLFNPSDVPDLHDLWGKKFEERYLFYEKMGDEGKILQFRRIFAFDLWRKMITMLFETGHPWMTFKDPSNVRSPQSHVGVIHSSNLCTEILLNTSKGETAVCNLGSVNLKEHMGENGLNKDLLKSTIRSAIRMLDNVIDLNFYPTKEAERSNLKHRPVGLGIMGFQEALYLQKIPNESCAAIEFADQSMELISYFALEASSDLSQERGAYSSFPGSKWSQGILPIDTIDLLEKERDEPVLQDRSQRLDWQILRKKIQIVGLRNSHSMAIAPTATSAQIMGCTQSIEPTYCNLFTKSNLSGEFLSINHYLVEDLKKINLWNEEMLEELKYWDGSIQQIKNIPEDIKQLYKTAFEIDPSFLIECASRRQKWIDMGQSLNLYVSRPSGEALSDLYFLAWKKGLKTLYYLRAQSATQIEKSTQDINVKGIQPRWMKSRSSSAEIEIGELRSCLVDEPCESCQ